MPELLEALIHTFNVFIYCRIIFLQSLLYWVSFSKLVPAALLMLLSYLLQAFLLVCVWSLGFHSELCAATIHCVSCPLSFQNSYSSHVVWNFGPPCYEVTPQAMSSILSQYRRFYTPFLLHVMDNCIFSVEIFQIIWQFHLRIVSDGSIVMN